MKLKNGWPWSSITNIGVSVSDDYIERAKALFHSVDWTDLKRDPNHKAIYPDTRVLHWNDHQPPSELNDEIVSLGNEALSYILPLFPECNFRHGEFVCLNPHGFIRWHRDIRRYHYYSSKILLLIENEDVEYSFSNWAANTPMNKIEFDESNYIDQIVTAKMKTGTFYLFNHRIPHMTKSLSDKPRYMIYFELVNKNIDAMYSMVPLPVMRDELEPLAPPVL